ncbi:MAG: hypothetical protein JWR21_3028 [Herminiimonas sp.]|nr:hypothetical protein [Herminiimonas sp.]
MVGAQVATAVIAAVGRFELDAGTGEWFVRHAVFADFGINAMSPPLFPAMHTASNAYFNMNRPRFRSARRSAGRFDGFPSPSVGQAVRPTHCELRRTGFIQRLGQPGFVTQIAGALPERSQSSVNADSVLDLPVVSAQLTGLVGLLKQPALRQVASLLRI